MSTVVEVNFVVS